MFDKIKKVPARVKNYVKEHPTECAWYAGLVTMGILNLAVDAVLRQKRINAWDAADELTLDLHGPDATTVVTRDGRFGAIYPIPNEEVE